MDSYKILIAEDNTPLSDMMRDYLISAGHTVFQAFDGDMALKLMDALKPDLVMLDIMMPRRDGFEVCATIRKRYNIPIIVMSAKVAESDKEKMFDLGADDYLTKPFSLKEGVMRVNAQLRRYYVFNKNKCDNNTKVLGALTICADKYLVELNGEAIPFSNKEIKLLDVLTDEVDRIFNKNQLIDLVWGEDEYIDENTVAVTISRIRDKLLKYNIDNIVTVWGLGYKWKS